MNVEAKYPNAKRLVVPCKNGSREIIEFSFTVAALITLSIPLRFIKTAFGNVAGTSFMASDAIGRHRANASYEPLQSIFDHPSKAKAKA